MRRKAVRRRVLRAGLVASNVLVLVVILAIVLANPHTGSIKSASSVSSTSDTTVSNPLDQLSSADIALTVAQLNALPEATAISNQAQSQAAELAMASLSDNAYIKTQVVATQLKSSADIQSYTTVAGDTVSSLATKFGVTSDSIRWSNNLTGDALQAGTKLVIPPVNGIVVTVKSGDTADSLAQKYKANKDKIVAFNDAEVNGLRVGSQIVIPDGTVAVASSASQIARTSVTSGAFAWGGAAVYGSNGYDYGYCTWYVASRISVPANWGNANTWDNYAPYSGWTVSTEPRAGAIAQTDAGYEGHVAIVEKVNDDGTIYYSDMNGLAGWGRVGYGTTSASHFMHYIYR